MAKRGRGEAGDTRPKKKARRTKQDKAVEKSLEAQGQLRQGKEELKGFYIGTWTCTVDQVRPAASPEEHAWAPWFGHEGVRDARAQSLVKEYKANTIQSERFPLAATAPTALTDAEVQQLKVSNASHDHSTGYPAWPLPNKLDLINGHARLAALRLYRKESASNYQWPVDVYSTELYASNEPAAFDAFVQLHVNDNLPVNHKPFDDAATYQRVVLSVYREVEPLPTQDGGGEGYKVIVTEEQEARRRAFAALGRHGEHLKKLMKDRYLRESLHSILKLEPYQASFHLSAAAKLLAGNSGELFFASVMTAEARRVEALFTPNGTINTASFTTGVQAALSTAACRARRQNAHYAGPPTIDAATGKVEPSLRDSDAGEWAEKQAEYLASLRKAISNLKEAPTFTTGDIKTLQRCMDVNRDLWDGASGVGDWYPYLFDPSDMCDNREFGQFVQTAGRLILLPIVERLYSKASNDSPYNVARIAPNLRVSFADGLRHATDKTEPEPMETLDRIASFIYHYFEPLVAEVFAVAKARNNKSGSIIAIDEHNKYTAGQLHQHYFHFNSLFSLIDLPHLFPFDHDIPSRSRIIKLATADVEAVDPSGWELKGGNFVLQRKEKAAPKRKTGAKGKGKEKLQDEAEEEEMASQDDMEGSAQGSKHGSDSETQDLGLGARPAPAIVPPNLASLGQQADTLRSSIIDLTRDVQRLTLEKSTVSAELLKIRADRETATQVWAEEDVQRKRVLEQRKVEDERWKAKEQERASSEAALKMAQSQLDTNRRRLSEEQARWKKEQEQVRRKQEEVGSRGTEADGQVRSLESLKADVKAARTDLATAQEELKTARTKLAETESSLAFTQNELAASKEFLTEVQVEVGDIEVRKQGLHKEIKAAEKRLQQLKVGITSAQQPHDTSRATSGSRPSMTTSASHAPSAPLTRPPTTTTSATPTITPPRAPPRPTTSPSLLQNCPPSTTAAQLLLNSSKPALQYHKKGAAGQGRSAAGGQGGGKGL